MRQTMQGRLACFGSVLLATLALTAGAAAQEAGGGMPQPDDVAMIRLRNGQFQWGMIEDHSADALTFRRLDTNGLVTLPWSFLDGEQELDLRTRFGYVEVGSEEFMIPAEKLIMKTGLEIVGLIQGRTEDTILFKSQGRTLEVPKVNVRSHVAGLQVPALEVYTKEELYRAHEESTDLETAEGNFEMAEFCEQILDFTRALEHYTAAQELDPTFMLKELPVILERVVIKVENKAQVDFLEHVDHLNRRKHFDKALEQLLEFDASFPDSPLIVDRLKVEERILKSRDRYMHEEVTKRWFSWMGRLAAKASRELTFEATMEYLDEALGEEILQNVTEDMRKSWAGIEPDHVRQYFIERKQGRWKPASYGLGTWLLGEEDALKGGSAAKAQKEPTTARDKKRAEQEEQIKRWLRNQEISKRASKSEEDEAEIGNFWITLPSISRRNWIIAYYAENSGHLAVREKPELQNCSECGGTGVRTIISTGSAREGASGGEDLITCPTCHGIARVRRIRYR